MAAESDAPAAPTLMPTTSAVAIGNIEFLQALTRALLALAISAVLLLTGYLTFSPELAAHREAASDHDIQTRVVNGNELMVRVGSGEHFPDKGLALTELGKDGRAIVTRRISLNANDYPFIRYKIRNHHPGEIIYLIWRTADNPEKLSSARLYGSGNTATTYLLANHKQWQGRITEIGLDIYGDLRNQPLLISSLEALPASRRHLLAAIWSDWNLFEIWKQTSINFLRAAPHEAVLSPTVVMASWAGMALLLLALAFSLKKAHHPISYAAAVLIPWITLDLLWQSRLSTQLEETAFLFQGKSQQEKHLVDADAELYQYAQHVNSEVLPQPGARIFILADNRGQRHEYRRLRTQFHLLPHNIYNYGSLPPRRHVRNGDYLLVLGEVKGLAFEPAKEVLRWGKGKRLKATLVDQHPVGTIYQVTRRDKP